MRNYRLLVVLMAALAAAGCARKPAQQSFYIVDPQTGQPVPVITQQQQAAPAATLYSNSAAYAQQAYAQQQSYTPPVAQPPQAASGRGLFSSNRRPPSRQMQQPSLRQPYVAQYIPPPAVAAPPRAAAVVAAPAAMPNYGYASASPATPDYTLDSGDKLRVVVFGQDGITNSYTVDAGGNVNMPLIGTVPARGTSPQQLAKTVADRLRQGFVREPHVTVEVETYRPFFILGEVTQPGQYPYVANMTVETAVAIAGGFGPRASKKTVELTRHAPGQQMRGDVPLNYPLQPGDTIVIKERWF